MEEGSHLSPECCSFEALLFWINPCQRLTSCLLQAFAGLLWEPPSFWGLAARYHSVKAFSLCHPQRWRGCGQAVGWWWSHLPMCCLVQHIPGHSGRLVGSICDLWWLKSEVLYLLLKSRSMVALSLSVTALMIKILLKFICSEICWMCWCRSWLCTLWSYMNPLEIIYTLLHPIWDFIYMFFIQGCTCVSHLRLYICAPFESNICPI